MIPDLARLPDPYPVAPIGHLLDADVVVPGSKSITNRALICAALADGPSEILGALVADDTQAMLGCLLDLGFEIRPGDVETTLRVTGGAGQVPKADAAIDVRQSGTTARFILPLCALGAGVFRVSAHEQMAARPMGTTFEALEQLGAGVEALTRPGHLPAVVRAGGLRSSVVRVPGDASSQFLSGLLLVAPCLPDGLVIELTTPLVSRPYVALTMSVMHSFGAQVEQPDERTFVVSPGGYRATTYTVEPDASAASYPLAAAAICGGRVRVRGLGDAALQGDAAFADVLSAMGAQVHRDADGVEVTAAPGSLTGGTFDFADISDTAQTLAVVAPFARTSVTITGIGFIRAKETDRVQAVADQLRRCGVQISIDADGWTIEPGIPRGADIETYEDHRMAMSFALLGLVTPDVRILDPGCVAKTFPGYWALLDELRNDHHSSSHR